MPDQPSLTDPMLSSYDTDGRCLDESKNDVELEACPYKDARFGHPFNKSALRQVADHWNSTRAIIDTCVASYRRQFADPSIRMIDQRRFFTTLSFLPSFLVLGQHVRKDQIPGPASALYKAMRGVNTAFHHIDRSERYQPNDHALTAEEIYLYVEKGGLLIRQGEVCAASKAMILEFLDHICMTQPQRIEDSGLPQLFSSPSVVDDFVHLGVIVTHFQDITAFCEDAMALSRKALERLEAETSQPDMEPSLLHRTMTDCVPENWSSLVEQMRRHIRELPHIKNLEQFTVLFERLDSIWAQINQEMQFSLRRLAGRSEDTHPPSMNMVPIIEDRTHIRRRLEAYNSRVGESAAYEC